MNTREIKFRVWDEHRKKMIYSLDTAGWVDTYRLLLTEENNLFCGNYMDNGDWQQPKLMQFTGLKDKNGTPIYECDIVMHGDHKLTCEFIDGCFSFECMISGTTGLSMSCRDHRSTEFEVIGNIYENPELLKL